MKTRSSAVCLQEEMLLQAPKTLSLTKSWWWSWNTWNSFVFSLNRPRSMRSSLVDPVDARLESWRWSRATERSGWSAETDLRFLNVRSYSENRLAPRARYVLVTCSTRTAECPGGILDNQQIVAFVDCRLSLPSLFLACQKSIDFHQLLSFCSRSMILVSQSVMVAFLDRT